MFSVKLLIYYTRAVCVMYSRCCSIVVLWNCSLCCCRSWSL